MIDWIWVAGRIVGVPIAAGLRGALTLAVLGFLAREGWGVHMSSSFTWLTSWTAILIFVLLAIVEIAIDKTPAFDRVQDRLLFPWRLAAGAIAAAALLGHGTTGMLVGFAVGALVAFLGLTVKFAARPRPGTPGLALPLVSLSEDLAAFAIVVLAAVFAPLGYAIFAWTLWLFVRLRRRRSAKYKGLRVLR